MYIQCVIKVVLCFFIYESLSLPNIKERSVFLFPQDALALRPLPCIFLPPRTFRRSQTNLVRIQNINNNSLQTELEMQ